MLYNINMKIINFLLQISLISVIVSPTCLDLA